MNEQELKAYQEGFDDAAKNLAVWHPVSEPPQPYKWVVAFCVDASGRSKAHRTCINADGKWGVSNVIFWCEEPEV